MAHLRASSSFWLPQASSEILLSFSAELLFLTPRIPFFSYFFSSHFHSTLRPSFVDAFFTLPSLSRLSPHFCPHSHWLSIDATPMPCAGILPSHACASPLHQHPFLRADRHPQRNSFQSRCQWSNSSLLGDPTNHVDFLHLRFHSLRLLIGMVQEKMMMSVSKQHLYPTLYWRVTQVRIPRRYWHGSLATVATIRY